MKRILLLTTIFMTMPGISFSSAQTDADNFYKSDSVSVEKVSSSNRYKVKVAGNLFLLKNMREGDKYPTIVVGHPVGTVKGQSANLCVTEMAERGFMTLSIDLSFWSGNEDEPRNAVLPGIYTEDFGTAVGFLGTRPFVDRSLIGVIGVYGSGSLAINTAEIDPHLKTIATIGIYNIGTASRNGLEHSLTLEQREQVMAEAAEQHYTKFLGKKTKYTGGTVHRLTEKSNPIEQEFYEFYRTQRGEFTPDGATPMTTAHPILPSNVKFMSLYPFEDIETISPHPMLFVTGENVHSREFSENTHRLAAEPKELYIVPGAEHVDLYDRMSLIPFNKLESFFKGYLKR